MPGHADQSVAPSGNAVDVDIFKRQIYRLCHNFPFRATEQGEYVITLMLKHIDGILRIADPRNPHQRTANFPAGQVPP